MDNFIFFMIGLIIGIVLAKTIDFISANVQFKKGFVSGYKTGLKESQLTNMKITTRFDPFKSMIITNHCHVPDSPDIDFHIMSEHREKELLEIQRSFSL